MTRRNPESYHAPQEDPAYYGPAVSYHPDTHPDVAEALDLLNHMALIDQNTQCLSYPNGSPEAHRAATEILSERADQAADHRLSIISLDIDLTLRIGEDYEDESMIHPSEISRLQQLGYIVGTCSDREPTDQRETLAALGQQPDFYIPKEMLAWAKKLLPGESHLHVGDDQRRDRDIAHQAGFRHQWPQEFQATQSGPNPL